ncbi:MAG: DUF6179 domain-containing protein [Clostridia bacterium]|nr:DUF6179 domain-containing protein [Clostridia bacterium]
MMPSKSTGTEFAAPADAQALTPKQIDLLQMRLFSLFKAQARAYTLGDSTSLPQDTANELMASLLYTLGVDPLIPGTYRPLLDEDIHLLYSLRLAALEKKADQARAFAGTLCLRTPDLGCIALKSTLSSILTGLHAYDARFFAHHIPGSIDYQLSLPVPQNVQGIDYILQYLARLDAELRFIGCFPSHRVLALLEGTSSRWRDLVCNLYMPVAVNALGLCLLDAPPRRLHISQAQRESLLALLAPLSASQLESRLLAGYQSLCATLSLPEEENLPLLCAAAHDLAPRLLEAVQRGDLSHVFFSFGLLRRR